MLPRASLSLFIAAICLPVVGAAGPASALTLLEFDFENASVNDPTVAASSSASVIFGGVFGGTKPEARVLEFSGDKIFTSAFMFPSSNGGYFSYLSFTVGSLLGVQLGSMSFVAQQNDCAPCSPIVVPRGPRSFDVLLSPANDPTPTGVRNTALASYTLLETIDVPYGFSENIPPNFELNLGGIQLGAGTYHVAFAASNPSDIITQTTQLFMDDVTLSTVVPEPTTAMLAVSGLVAMALWRRRRH